MATIIEQKPLYTTLPVGQDVIFSLSNTSIVSGFTRVKFLAEVHISSGIPPNVSVADDLVGTFKTTPNNAGAGMFDLSPIIESYVKADNLAMEGSGYKKSAVTPNIPIHLIDKYSGNLNTMRYLAIQFKIEHLDTEEFLPGGVTPNPTYNQIIIVDAVNSDLYKLFNGYLKYTDDLDLIGNNFGYNISKYNLSSPTDSFLTNAPATQEANLEDYGVISILALNNELHYFKLNYLDSTGTQIDTENVFKTNLNGAYDVYDASIAKQLLYFGCFPANLQNWSIKFQALVSAGTIQGGSIEVQAFNDQVGGQISKKYTIDLNCPTLKGFEPIRLTWLNQWGVWDYYTFTMKSSKSISTKGSTYQQLEGSWNDAHYKIDSFKGGKKAFRVNATEKVSMNTDFVSEVETEWFEELINSPEVYIIEGYKTDATNSALNKYVTPVRLTTSSYTKKTVANDKLIQYTFEVEKSKTLRTQSI